MRARKLVTWSFLFLMLAAVGLVAWCWRSSISGSAKSPAPDEVLSADTGLVLPKSAVNIQAYRIELMALWVCGRFDMPRDELASVLQTTPRAPQMSDLRPDLKRVSELKSLDWLPAWWQPGELRDPKSASRAGVDDQGSRPWKWSFEIHAGTCDRLDFVRVYIIYTEEPG